MKKLAIVPFLVLAACGETYSTPTGTVAGEVTSGVTDAPIAGASVSLWTGDAVFETDTGDDGRFVIDGVPSGSSLWLDVVAEGFAYQRWTVQVDDAAGEEPQDNSVTLVEAQLFPDDNQIRVRVQDFGGDPISGAVVYAVGRGESFRLPDRLTATTDAGGLATLSGVALWQTYEIRAEPMELAGEMVAGQTVHQHRSNSEIVDLYLE